MSEQIELKRSISTAALLILGEIKSRRYHVLEECDKFYLECDPTSTGYGNLFSVERRNDVDAELNELVIEGYLVPDYNRMGNNSNPCGYTQEYRLSSTGRAYLEYGSQV
jgi:hypothetical protein